MKATELEEPRIGVVRPDTTYIVPVSGGKDSQVCAAWALDYVPLKQLRFVHQNTGFDHPITYKHLRYMARRYGVKIEHTHSSKYDGMFDFIEKVGYFPGQVARGCTSRLKQEPPRTRQNAHLHWHASR